jgi:hypothetical protein
MTVDGYFHSRKHISDQNSTTSRQLTNLYYVPRSSTLFMLEVTLPILLLDGLTPFVRTGDCFVAWFCSLCLVLCYVKPQVSEIWSRFMSGRLWVSLEVVF